MKIPGQKYSNTKCWRCGHKSYLQHIKNKPHLYPKYCGKCGRKYPKWQLLFYKSKWYIHHIQDKILHRY